MALHVTSPAFAGGDRIPRAFTCDGRDEAVPLTVTGVPLGTESFAVIMDDPDAPGGPFTHWLAYDLPNEGHVLRPEAGKTLANDFGRVGYGGPCPPRSHGAHRYEVTVFAVDIACLNVRGASRRDLEAALEGHTLARSTLVGRYQRPY
ncbi:MAG: YbhB/YbcL family Raf kinase inhibitor-like protein [Vicinamibacterales bacterium]